MSEKQTRALVIFPVILALYEFLVNSSNSVFIPALPTVARDLLASDSSAQRTVSVWFTGAALFQLLLGPLSDKMGRRFVFLTGGIVFIVATLACAFAQSVESLSVFRFFEGIGVCTLTMGGYAAIHESSDEKRGLKILAIMSAFAELAPLLGPFIASWFLTYQSWRGIFIFLFVASTIAYLGLGRVMPETNLKPDPLALHPGHMIRRYLRILRHPSFNLAVLSYGFLYAGLTAWSTSSPFLLMNLHHLTPNEFGLASLPTCIAYILAAISVKQLANTLSLERIIFLGLSTAVAGSVIFCLTSLIWPDHLGAVIISMCVYCAGCGLSFSSFNRKIIFSSGENLGAVAAIQNLGMIGVAALGSFFASFIFNGTAFSVAISSSLMVFVAMALNAVRIAHLSRKQMDEKVKL